MKIKNWKESIFLSNMIIPFLYVILSSIAMLFYAGGTYIDSNTQGYSFWSNFLSDLGRTRGYSGKSNTISCVLFTIMYTTLGFFLIPFFFFLPHFFNENEAERRICIIASIFGIGTGISYIGVAFTPWDLYFLAHGAFGVISSLTLLIALFLYSIVMIRNKTYPKKNTFTLIALDMLLVISIILPLIGVSIETAEGLMITVTIQKILTYFSLVFLFIHSYSAWKQEKL